MLAPRQKLWSTPREGVAKACDLLALGPNDRVFDVGCGDGRFLIEAAKRGAAGVGFEIDANRAEEARSAAAAAGVGDLVDVRTVNALECDFVGATAVFLYLVPRGLRIIAPRLLDAARKKPLRVVTYMAPLPGVGKPAARATVTPAHQPSAAWPLYYYELDAASAPPPPAPVPPAPAPDAVSRPFSRLAAPHQMGVTTVRVENGAVASVELSVRVRVVGGEVERSRLVATLCAYDGLVARADAGEAAPRVDDAAWERVGAAASLALGATRYRGPLRCNFALGPGAGTPPASFDGVVLVCAAASSAGAWGAKWAAAAEACGACVRIVTRLDGAFDGDLAAWAVGNGFEYCRGVDVSDPCAGREERDADGIPRLVEALAGAAWPGAAAAAEEAAAAEAAERAPAVAITGDGPGARRLFRAICARIGAIPGGGAGGDDATATLTTKYYATPLRLALVAAGAPLPPRCEAVIAVAPQGSDARRSWPAGGAAKEATTKLLAAAPRDDGEADQGLQSWAAGAGVEVVGPDDAARVFEALEATLWSTVAPPPTPPPHRDAPSPSPPAAAPAAAPAPPPPAAPPAADRRRELESLEDMIAELRERPPAAFTSDEARRARAADLAERMAAALDLSDSSDSDGP